MSEGGGSRVIRVTNVAPQATRDQMHTLFSHIGRIDDIRLYPSVRDASVSISSRVSFVKFSECSSAIVGTHLNNTVFIDRALIVAPVRDGLIPEEAEGLSAAHASSSAKFSESKFPPNITNSIQGNLVFTGDTLLDSAGLPGYPPMPAATPTETLEELRRTVCVSYIDPGLPAQQCMEFFAKEAGEVKYFRYCSRAADSLKYALIEFTNQSSVIPALLLNDRVLGENQLKVTHATKPIIKLSAKSNEDAQKEIEEALTRVKEAQSLVAATVDPLMGMLGGNTTTSTTGSSLSVAAAGGLTR
ncbi:Putative splicing factor_ arginine/serinerich 7like, partial [Caligus rogercresseyi]